MSARPRLNLDEGADGRFFSAGVKTRGWMEIVGRGKRAYLWIGGEACYGTKSAGKRLVRFLRAALRRIEGKP